MKLDLHRLRRQLCFDYPELRAALYGPRARWRGIVRAHMRWGESYVLDCGNGFASLRCSEPMRHDVDLEEKAAIADFWRRWDESHRFPSVLWPRERSQWGKP